MIPGLVILVSTALYWWLTGRGGADTGEGPAGPETLAQKLSGGSTLADSGVDASGAVLAGGGATTAGQAPPGYGPQNVNVYYAQPQTTYVSTLSESGSAYGAVLGSGTPTAPAPIASRPLRGGGAVGVYYE